MKHRSMLLKLAEAEPFFAKYMPNLRWDLRQELERELQDLKKKC
jgi:hypothetical protein